MFEMSKVGRTVIELKSLRVRISTIPNTGLHNTWMYPAQDGGQWRVLVNNAM